MFVFAVVWYVVGTLSVVAYVTASRVAHPQWFTAATIIYGLLGLIPLLYGLPAVRRVRAESHTLANEVEA